MVIEGAKAIKNTKFQNSFNTQSNKIFFCLFPILLNKIKIEINSDKEHSTIFFSNSYNFRQLLQRNIRNNLIELLLQKLIYVATVELPTLEMISLYCSFSTQIAVEFLCTSTFIWTWFYDLSPQTQRQSKDGVLVFQPYHRLKMFVLIIYF